MCCRSIFCSGDEQVTARLRAFGEKVGIAFQIKDDLFDYAADNVGKPTGNDIKEKKLDASTYLYLE
jgi:octaprenyl-diphosphate synthase